MLQTIKKTIYKITAFIILAVCFALGIVTLHFSLAKAKIIITTNQVPISKEMKIKIPINKAELDKKSTETNSKNPRSSDLSTLRSLVLGKDDNDNLPNYTPAYIKEIPVEITTEIEPEGKIEQINAKATGMVTIYNEMNFNQVLVATTRLLTPNNILFRTQERILVPAHGSIQTLIKADVAGANGNIKPTSFIIPGLSPARQKLVYAKNHQPFTGGVKKIKKLTLKDFNLAEEETKQELKEKAIKKFNNQGVIATDSNVYLDQVSFNSPNNPGDEKEKITMNANGIAYVLIFNHEALIAQTKNQIKQELGTGQKILAYNEESFYFKINKIEPEKNNVEITTYLEAYATLDENNSLEKKELAGLKPQEAQNKLLKNDTIQQVQIKLSPFWVTKIPRRSKKIIISINNEEKNQEEKNTTENQEKLKPETETINL